MANLRPRTALGLALVTTVGTTLPLTALAADPQPPAPDVQIGATVGYPYPTDTPGAGLIDKDGSFHVQQSAALYGANDVREWDFLKGTNFDDLVPDQELAKAVNPANPLDRNDDTTWRCNNSVTGKEATMAPPPSDYSQPNYCDLVGWWADPDTGDWHGLVHNEFTPSPFGDGLHYDAIDHAVSHDQGRTWTITGHVLTSPWSTKRGDTAMFGQQTYNYGDGDPRLFVDQASGWFYVYYGSRVIPKKGVGGSNGGLAHVARAPMSGKMAPGTWQKWFDGAWSQPGIGGRESNLVPVTPQSPLGYTPVDKDYKPTTPGNVDEQVAAGTLPQKSDLFIMNIAWDAHLGKYIGAPEVVKGVAPQRYYVTDNLATQKWSLIGDSGSQVSGSWYRWFLDSGNRTDSMVVGRTMRSYCSIACSTSDGEYSELTIGGNLPSEQAVPSGRAMRLESGAGLALGQAAEGSATTAQRWSTKEKVPHAVALKQWQFVAVGDGSYRIQNLATGDALGVDSTRPAQRAWGVHPQAMDVVTEGQAAVGQQWWVIPVRNADGVEGDQLRVVNRYTQTALALGAHGAELTPVRSWTDRTGSSVGDGRSQDEQLLTAKAMGQAPDVVSLLTVGRMRTDEGQQATYRLTATDSHGLPVRFTATGLPDGVSLSADGVISGAATTAGVYQVKVTATTSTGASATTSFEWVVSPVVSGVHQVLTGGMALDVADSSTAWAAAVVVQTPGTATSQRWDFVRQDDGSYQLRNQNSGLCLDVNGGSSKPGTRLIQWTCGTGDNQRWLLQPTSTGLGLVSKLSGLSLSVASATAGAAVTQEIDQAAATQRWTIA